MVAKEYVGHSSIYISEKEGVTHIHISDCRTINNFWTDKTEIVSGEFWRLR